MIVHELGYLITENSDGTFAFTRPDGTPMPASPPLPSPGTGTGTDITSVHDAAVTAETINTSHHDRLDLHLAIWAHFANARNAAARSSAKSGHTA